MSLPSRTRCFGKKTCQNLAIISQRRFLFLSPAQRNTLTSWLAQHEFPFKQPTLLDQLSVRRIQELYSTLPTLDGSLDIPSHRQRDIRKGTELSPGHSLIFCNPVAPNRQLESDGTISVCPAPEPFVRRMWAGGSFQFLRPLYIGDEIMAERNVKNIEIKRLDSENPMVIVEQEIKMSSFNESDSARTQSPCVIETRSHVYVPISDKQRPLKPEIIPDDSGHDHKFSFLYVPTDTTLFRFSALTFNAHRIHLDRNYAQNVEGLQERLVHGPMTALMLLEGIENYKPPNMLIEKFEYRATNPLFVDQHIIIRGQWTDDTRTEVKVWAQTLHGVVGMKGRAWLKESR